MAYDSNTFRLPDPSINPNAPGFMSVGLKDNAVGTRNKLNTGGAIQVSFAGNYWDFMIEYPALTEKEARFIQPLLNYTQAKKKPIYVQLPQYVEPITGPWSGDFAQGQVSLGDTADTLLVPNWASRGGDLSPGDMLKLSNSHKIYQVVTKTISDGSGGIAAGTGIILLHCDVLEPNKVPTCALEPNDIKFRCDLIDIPTFTLMETGFYSAVSVTFEENIL